MVVHDKANHKNDRMFPLEQYTIAYSSVLLSNMVLYDMVFDTYVYRMAN